MTVVDKDIQLFDVVRLKDGRRVTVVEIYKSGEAFECEDVKAELDGKDFGECLFTVGRDQIECVEWRGK